MIHPPIVTKKLARIPCTSVTGCKFSAAYVEWSYRVESADRSVSIRLTELVKTRYDEKGVRVPTESGRSVIANQKVGL